MSLCRDTPTRKVKRRHSKAWSWKSRPNPEVHRLGPAAGAGQAFGLHYSSNAVRRAQKGDADKAAPCSDSPSPMLHRFMFSSLRFFGLAAALICCGLPGGFRAAVSAPPNIVLILSDDMAWTDYGFMGHPDIETPNLDKLASQSAVFPRGYVPTALCRPSLATLLTGHYAH